MAFITHVEASIGEVALSTFRVLLLFVFAGFLRSRFSWHEDVIRKCSAVWSVNRQEAASRNLLAGMNHLDRHQLFVVQVRVCNIAPKLTDRVRDIERLRSTCGDSQHTGQLSMQIT